MADLRHYERSEVIQLNESYIFFGLPRHFLLRKDELIRGSLGMGSIVGGAGLNKKGDRNFGVTQ